MAGAGKLTPAIDWPRYLEMMGVAGHDSVIIGEPSYFKELSRALGDVPLAVWRNYLRVRVVDDLAPYLNAEVVERAFDFNGRTITGTPRAPSRAGSAALTEVEGSIGDLLGKVYVARHFPPEAKARMDAARRQPARRVRRVGIDELDWMGPRDASARRTAKLAQLHGRRSAIRTSGSDYPGS